MQEPAATSEANPETESWCAGLPCLGSRPLTPAERDAVTMLSQRLRSAWWQTLALLLAVLVSPLALEGHRFDVSPWLAVTLSVVVGLGFLIAIAGLVLRARDVWRARAGFQRDLADGNVLEFGGAVPSTTITNPDQRRLVEAGLLFRGLADDQSLAVLPVTHRVLVRDARRGWRTLKVRVRTAVAPPTYAMRSPVSSEIATPIDSAKELVKRSLSGPERDEIQGYIRQVWRSHPRYLLVVPYTAICVMLLVRWIQSREHSMIGILGPALGFFFITHSVRRLAFLLHRTRLLERDVATGWVFTLRARALHELEVEEVAAANPPAPEFLPHSRLIWTEAGRPAGWRNLA